MITFNHSGKIGDILYSLYFCKELSEKYGFDKFNLNIQLNVETGQCIPGESKYRMTERTFNFLKPLLESISCINTITSSSYVPENSFNLDNFRKLPLNTMCGDICEYVYSLCLIHLKKDFNERLIYINNDFKNKNKIILFKTLRYNNVLIDYKCIEPFKDDLIFIGTDEEYDDFCKSYFNIERIKISNALELAKEIVSAKYILSSECGNFAIAELMKIPRVLIPPSYIKTNNGVVVGGPCNVICHGGYYDYIHTNEQLVGYIKNTKQI